MDVTIFPEEIMVLYLSFFMKSRFIFPIVTQKVIKHLHIGAPEFLICSGKKESQM